MSHKEFGNWGEGLVVDYLKSQGYQLIERNFKNKIGEIDIIAKDQGVICFIEVKTRKNQKYGEPLLAVNRHKQLKLVKLAYSYLKLRYKTIEIQSRFDVVSVINESNQAPDIKLIKNAFDLTYLII